MKRWIAIVTSVLVLLSYMPAFASGYTDIDGNKNQEYIRTLLDKGILKADEERFYPEHNITRAEFLDLCVRTANWQMSSYHCTFADVNKQDWYAASLQTAYDKRIIPQDMIVDRSLLPNQPLLREEAAAILVELFGKLHGYKVAELSVERYSDRLSISPWAVSAIESALEFGFLDPASANTVAPKVKVTRGEAAKMMCRILEQMKNVDRETLVWDDIPIDSPIEGTGIIKWASEFGMTPDNPDNYSALTEALEYCKENHVYKLLIPKGTYHFETPYPVALRDMSDFILDGQGSDFIFGGRERLVSTNRNYINLYDCNRVVLRNFTMDWDWETERLASLGVVVSDGLDGNSFEMEFPEVDYMPEEQIDKKFHRVTSYDSKTYKVGVVDGIEDGSYNGVYTVEKRTGPNRFIISAPSASSASFYKTKGSEFLIRHYEYEFHGIGMSGVKHVSLDGISIFSTAGHGIAAGNGSTFWEFVNSRITIKPGSGRHISSNTDGMHIGSPNGYFKVENCQISFQGDDATNAYRYLTNAYTKNPDKKNAIDILYDTWRYPLSVGDEIEFRNEDMSESGFKAVATLVVDNSSNYYVEFDRDLPDELADGLVMKNNRYSAAHYVFRNNVFSNNRARGSLLHEGYALVENNIYHGNMGPNVLFTNGIGRWGEGFDMENTIFRNNLMSEPNAMLSGSSAATIDFQLSLPNGGETNYAAYRNILIEGNTFIEPIPAAISVHAARNVKIRNNTIMAEIKQPYGSNVQGAIQVRSSSEVTVSGNRWIKSEIFSQDEDIRILFQSSAKECVSRDNVLIRNDELIAEMKEAVAAGIKLPGSAYEETK